MKMVIRADDVGFTHVHNIGTFEAVDNGLVTSCDVMLDTPGTIEALEFLRERPWISTGWHTHFWGAPVLNPADVPTLYDSSIGHFRRDLAQAEDVSYDEILAEMRAQMDLCIKYLGRTLDVGGGAHGNSPFARAMTKVTEEYGLVCNFAHAVDFRKMFMEGICEYTVKPDAKWEDRKIYMTVEKRGGPVNEVFSTDSIKVMRSYEPLQRWVDDEVNMAALPEDATAVVVLHPGYIDYYVAREGSQTPRAWNYLSTRTLEVHALCSQELKDWVVEKQVELVNFRDALYGTREYQNHLRYTGSPLLMK